MFSPEFESARRKGRLFCSNIDKEDSAICRDDVNKDNSSASRVVHKQGKENLQSWKGGVITTSMMTDIAYLIYISI